MIERIELAAYLDELLDVSRFKDYAPNGLQVEGKSSIKRIVTGVTASLALIEQAVLANADALFVHHGYFWKGEQASIVGIKARRIKALITADLNLFAYHLPLDCHPTLGNNACLARLLDFRVITSQAVDGCPDLLWLGELDDAVSGEVLQSRINARLARTPLHLEPANSRPIKRVAWCSGGAQRYFEQAIVAGVDAFITGEVSEPMFHLAKETGVHFFSAGHHATERYGIQALGEQIAKKFSLENQFIDIDNPV